MFISTAYAQAGGQPDPILQFLPFVLIIVVFYFLLIRPQQKKMKQHKAMIEAVRRGDKVVTGGGLVGTVAKVVNETELELDLAENVRVRVLKHTLGDVLSKPEPASGGGGGGGKAKAANDDSGKAGEGGAKPGGLFGLFGGKK